MSKQIQNVDFIQLTSSLVSRTQKERIAKNSSEKPTTATASIIPRSAGGEIDS